MGNSILKIIIDNFKYIYQKKILDISIIIILNPGVELTEAKQILSEFNLLVLHGAKLDKINFYNEYEGSLVLLPKLSPFICKWNIMK